MGKIKQKISIFLSITILLAPILMMAGSANAVSSDDFLNNKIYYNLISNRDFVNFDSMNVASIQSFLEHSPFNNRSPLADYSEGGRSAAQIIYDAAHGRKFTVPPTDTYLGEDKNGIVLNESTGTINPQVILVFLQKEQSLISGPDDMAYALKHAMGYGCPDSGGCDHSDRHPHRVR